MTSNHAKLPDMARQFAPHQLVLCFLLILFLPAVPGGRPAAAESEIVIDDFRNGLDPHWQEKIFKGRTLYAVREDADPVCLEAYSADSASGLIYRVEYDPHKLPLITWQWRVDNVLARGDATTKEGDDYAARIYVVFPALFFWQTRMINYIWANKLPKGDAAVSPYTSRGVMIAVQSGPARTGQWITETRNVYEDYKRYYGSEPPMVGAIAIMTDTDQTGETARACYGPIRVRGAAP